MQSNRANLTVNQREEQKPLNKKRKHDSRSNHTVDQRKEQNQLDKKRKHNSRSNHIAKQMNGRKKCTLHNKGGVELCNHWRKNITKE